MISRRDFLKYAGIAGAAVTLPLKFGVRSAQAYAVSPGIQKFIDPMRGFLGGQIPLASKNTARYPGVDYYEITGGVYRDVLGTNMQNAFPGYTGTRLYGYKDTTGGTFKHLGGGIIAKKGTPVRAQFTNALPAGHIIPFDATIAQGNPAGTAVNQDHMAIHLHGGLDPWTSDGGPFHWFKPGTPGAQGGRVVGPSVVYWLPNDTGVNTDDIYYPNNQSARLMWYHDHAVGITRTSAYAGLAAPYILTDSGLPGSIDDSIAIPVTEYLVFQDKVFYSAAADPAYTAYVPGALDGDLWYPYIYDPKIWKLQGTRGKGLPIPSAVAEMFGDTMLVNGTPYPSYSVSGTTVRFRLLNACNARFLNLKFVYEDPAIPGEPAGGYVAPNPAPVDVYVLGTEGGYLRRAFPVILGGVPTFVDPLLMGPAERLDIIVDFTSCANKKVLLYSDAAAPYPLAAGNPIFDFYPGNALNPGAAGIANGFGPNTRTIMQFVVGAAAPAGTIPTTLAPAGDFLGVQGDAVNGGLTLNPAPAAGQVYTVGGLNYTFAKPWGLTLNEAFDAFGRLMQEIGTTVPVKGKEFGRTYIFDAPTEIVGYNTVEIWNVYNLTADAHPMHTHLFNAMILSRRLFKTQNFGGTPVYVGLGRNPEPTETGWKETFKMYPGEETKIAVLVEDPLPGRAVIVKDSSGTVVGTGTVPPSPRLAALIPPVPGDEFVWHCHILEHEEHDMMRPLVAQ